MGKITEYPTVGSLSDNDKLFVNVDGHLRQIAKKDAGMSGGGGGATGGIVLEHNEFVWCSSEFPANQWSNVSTQRNFTKSTDGKTIIMCQVNSLRAIDLCIGTIKILIDGQESNLYNNRFTIALGDDKLSAGSTIFMLPNLSVGTHTYKLEIYPSKNTKYYGDTSFTFQVFTI